MIAYTGWTRSERKFFYIPSVLLSFEYVECDMKKIRHVYDPENLSFIDRLVLDGLDADYLNKNGWRIAKGEIFESKVKNFVDACFKNKFPKRLREEQRTLFKFIQNAFENLQDFEDKLNAKLAEEGDDNLKEGFDDESDYVKQHEKDYPYDGEDYFDDWWKRGEKENSSLDEGCWKEGDWEEDEDDGWDGSTWEKPV